MEFRWMSAFVIHAVVFGLLVWWVLFAPSPIGGALVVIEILLFRDCWRRYQESNKHPIQNAEDHLKEYTLFGSMEELTKLRDTGMIDDEEFVARREKILEQG